MDKTTTQRLHSKRRAQERLGIRLSDTDLDNIVYLIQSHQGKYITRQSHRVTVWKVHYRDSDMQVLYDKTRQNIITVFEDDVKIVKPQRETARTLTCPFCDTADSYSTQKKYKICNMCGNSFV